MSVLFMFIRCLFLTLVIEMSLSLLFGVRKKGLIIVMLVNILTNPLAVLICTMTELFLPFKWYYPVQIVVEIAVFVSEALIYAKARKKEIISANPFLLSAVLNGTSWLTGIVINFLNIM